MMMVGRRFGKLTVTSAAPLSRFYKKPTRWICKCDCGNVVNIRTSYLLHGDRKSCGCLKSCPWEKVRKELIDQIFTGKRDKEIALAMNVKKRSVKHYISRLARELGIPKGRYVVKIRIIYLLLKKKREKTNEDFK